jgi:ABC-type branched-subunit amino acid transport system ATPase component
MEIVRDLAARGGLAFLVVSHGVSLLVEHATHLLFLDRDCGCVVAGTRDRVLASPELAEHFEGARHPGPGGDRP